MKSKSSKLRYVKIPSWKQQHHCFKVPQDLLGATKKRTSSITCMKCINMHQQSSTCIKNQQHASSEAYVHNHFLLNAPQLWSGHCLHLASRSPLAKGSPHSCTNHRSQRLTQTHKPNKTRCPKNLANVPNDYRKGGLWQIHYCSMWTGTLQNIV